MGKISLRKLHLPAANFPGKIPGMKFFLVGPITQLIFHMMLGKITPNSRKCSMSGYGYHPKNWTNVACQANHIFSRLNIAALHSQYVFVYRIRLDVHILPLKLVQPPAVPSESKAFLFICPPASLLSSDGTQFQIPERLAYWSFDPNGAQPLTTIDTLKFGLPLIAPSLEVVSKKFDGSVYTGLHQFHRGKGFDPESQDVTRHEGHPLFCLSIEQKQHKEASHINYSVAHDPDMKPKGTTTDNPSETKSNGPFILCFLAKPKSGDEQVTEQKQHQDASHTKYSVDHDPNMKPNTTTTDDFSEIKSNGPFILCFLAKPKSSDEQVTEQKQHQDASHTKYSVDHNPNMKPNTTTTNDFSETENNDEQILYPRLRQTSRC
ncbi:hypothetical protein DFH08DRAFT_465447 [Mycena albidolilacea]|uniref:Uncharacterized protein n=1 Tax=Mycena albidolilacea TaxID=1033008 RepID=A0AAD7EXL4_9AGAR|nr:hypothetical protein DFH08DRAFT_465447 [Mycena albidolilacea]